MTNTTNEPDWLMELLDSYRDFWITGNEDVGISTAEAHAAITAHLLAAAEEAVLQNATVHEHKVYVTQCEEGCDCDYLFLQCETCPLHEIVDGWSGCNINWEWWIKEDPEGLEKIAERLAVLVKINKKQA